jgi:hypothetical protein
MLPKSRFNPSVAWPSRAIGFQGILLSMPASLAWNIGIADWFVTMMVTAVLAVRVRALKKQGRALEVPSIRSTLFNNIPYWRFLLSREHREIGDAMVSYCVWLIRLGIAVFLSSFLLDFVRA